MKILIVDDHAVVREGYNSLLSSMLDHCEVIEAESGEQSCTLYTQHRPDLVIMDVNLSGISGIEATRRILQKDNDAKILFFSMFFETPLVKQALDTGASGYITKSCSPDILLDAVKKVLQGQIYVEHDIAIKLALTRPGQVDHRFHDLTQREFEIFVMLARGLAAKAISESLCISTKTISNYNASIKNKLGIETTAELVHLAIETGVIRLGRN